MAATWELSTAGQRAERLAIVTALRTDEPAVAHSVQTKADKRVATTAE